MSEYFEGFKWALPKSFSDPLSKCRFEQGDILYNTPIAYSVSWGEAKEKVKYSIQIKSPSTTSTTQLTENAESIFSSNWNSEVVFDLYEYPSLSKTEIKTTQGNLYSTLWKDNLSFILNTETQNEIPLLSKDISQIPEIIQLFLPGIIKKGYEYIFYFPIDETSSISREKILNIEKVFQSSGIDYKNISINPQELEILKAISICPTVKITLFLINGQNKKINEALKNALYLPSKTKKTEKEVFRLKTHGTFLKDYQIDLKHYFNISLKSDAQYFKSFLNNFEPLRRNLTRQELEALLNLKLQLKTGAFDEKPFVQMACETAVNCYFSRKYPDSFIYEKNVNQTNAKNVECQFNDTGFLFNVEVKCADFETKEKIEGQDSFKFSTYGRMADYKEAMVEIGDLMIEGQKKKGDEIKPLIEQRKMDNTLKDFLISANEKFNQLPNENEVNILVVCCGDAIDMQSWHNYMYAPSGLFSKNPFHNPKAYSSVDLVVLTNLYHRHKKYFSKPQLTDNWNLEAAFNLVFSNPYRMLNKEKSIKHFLNVFPHYTYELEKFDLPPSNEPEFMRNVLKSIVGIPAFVKYNFTDKGIFIF